MIKSLLICFAAISLGASAAQAGVMKVPNAQSAIVSVDIPDSWHPEPMEDGAAGTSDDGGDVKVVSFKEGMDKAMKNTFGLLEAFSVQIDQASKNATKVKINGMEGEQMLFQGKQKLGSHLNPVSVTIVVLSIKGKVVVLTHFVDTENAKKTKEVVDKIINSLKPLP